MSSNPSWLPILVRERERRAAALSRHEQLMRLELRLAAGIAVVVVTAIGVLMWVGF
jgi:hypothetical protein